VNLSVGILASIATLTAAIAAATGIVRIRRWSVGRSADIAIVAGLIAAPKRYLVDLHAVVARHKPSAWMHIASAGGFLLVLAAFIASAWWPDIAMGGLALASLMMVIGAGLDFARRWGSEAARLPRLPHIRLPVALLVLGTALGAFSLANITGYSLAVPAQVLLAVSIGYGLLELLGGLALGPMRHAFAGVLNLAFHHRPRRFARTPDVGAIALDLHQQKLGVEKPRDWPWNRLLQFDACVACGRCEAVCPAHDAGQPLNPRALVTDLIQATSSNSDSALVHDAGPISPDVIWACTTCRACVAECPMMIEHVDAIIDMRRFQTLERGRVPHHAADVLEELRLTGNASGRAAATRLDWAVDLNVPIFSSKPKAEVLLWLGQAAFDIRGQRTLRSLIRTLQLAAVDFACLGEEELDCGEVARRLGDEATFLDLAMRNIASLAKYDFKVILTADPHVYNTLKNEYPALGMARAVISHVDYLARLITEHRLPITRGAAQAVAFHDPCHLARYNHETESPRRILQALGAQLREPVRSGVRTHCCGAGGGAALTDVPGKTRIADRRLQQLRETGAGTVAVACPNCAVMFEGAGSDRLPVADIAELVWTAVEHGKPGVNA
jgi:dimethylglycine catabolism B